jgi:NADH-quinone oxidoreductase subunit N
VLVLIAVVNTVISLYYYLRIVKAMFIDAPAEDAVGRFRTDGYNRVSLVICVVAMIAVGIASAVFTYTGQAGF